MSTNERDLTSPLRRHEPRALVRIALLFYAGLLGLAWAWRGAIRGRSLWIAEGGSIDWLRDPLVGVAAAALVVGISAVITEHTNVGRSLARALGAALGPLRTRDCVLLAAVSGIAEEALFRGALQPEVGFGLASVLFAAAHFVPRRGLWPWSVFALGAGLLLGALYDSTGNLVAPAVAHFGINAINLRKLSRDHGTSD